MKMKSVYETLLRLYPADYRSRFAAEMSSTFEEAASDCRKRGMLRSVHFALVELLGLPISAAAEWMAKLSTDRSIRGRCLPDLRMMRPPGVPQKLWFANTGTIDSQHNAPSEAIGLENEIAIVIDRMVHAIANHDFSAARSYSGREREMRAQLLSVREAKTMRRVSETMLPLE